MIDTTELQRQLNNLIRVGVVHSADYPNAVIKVTLGEQVTGWLPWLTHRAGGDRSWWAPEVGEQVIVLSPSGDVSSAMVLPAMYQSSKAAPKNAETVHHTIYEDGTFIEYDRATHKLTVNVAGGDVLVTTTNNVNVSADGDASIAVGGKADVTATGDVNIDGANIKLNQGDSGGVVCQLHVCSLTGAAHPQGSLTVKGGG